MYSLSFIKQEDFEKHVLETIESYFRSYRPFNLESFNSNIIDPIKLLFDKNFQKKSYEEIIMDEIRRQRDKSDNNSIGYFHQNIFKYINSCEVPNQGWDIIYKSENKTIYVEMKNKHNTMNAASSQRTYIKMQSQLLDEPNCFLYLVEVIAKRSQNIEWRCHVDKVPVFHERIRRVSIDQFYKEITGIDDAFFQICKQLPITIESLLSEHKFTTPTDTVIQELKEKNPDILKALYNLAFGDYIGF